MKHLTIAACAALALVPPGAWAHHSSAGFDRQTRVAIEGEIVRYEWINPHVYLWIDAEDETGERATWEVEGLPPAILRRLGWTADTVETGDRVTVRGNPGRDPTAQILLMDSIEKAETVLDLTPGPIMAALSEGAATARAESLVGTWVTVFDPQVLQLFTAANIDVTEKGQAAIDSYVEEIESPALECIPFTAPMLMTTPDVKSFELRDDALVLRGEFDAIERTIHLNADSREGAVPSVQGHSIGRFEGRALIVDTAHFAPHRSLSIGLGLPSGAHRHLIERFELNEQGTHLTYRFELEDPEFLAAPITGSVRWAYRPDIEYAALPCDVENARRFVGH